VWQICCLAGRNVLLTTEVIDDGDHLRVALVGEIDAETQGLVQEAADCFDPLRHRSLELDLSGVTFVDSSGIGALVDAHRLTDAASARIVLVEPSHRVLRVLTLVGLAGYFSVAATPPTP